MSQPFVVQPRAGRVPVAAPDGTREGTPAATAAGVPAAARAVVELDATAFGPLAPFLRGGDVTDAFVNGADGLYVDRGGGAARVDGWRASEREVRDLAVRLIGLGGRHIDDATPAVDVRLAGGVRVHAVLPPVAKGGTALSIRIPTAVGADLAALRRGGTFDEHTERWLIRTIRARENVLVTGATGSGKTTLLGALLAQVPASERIVTIEDVAELRVPHPHHVALEARQPNLEGAGGVGLPRLVRESLRMRPDRIVVGECRGEEVRELLTALNTGHDGGAGTLHASGLADVPARLEALGALAGMDDHAVARQVTSAIAWVIHLENGPEGRRLASVGRFGDRDGRLTIEEVRPWE
ncbi:TadA family conjugal transfer-associated ATPase [Microbacterium halophytorum]|uniref:TadA family conjugal transfer-associated ATPase n=1 Tax=Microbacterium halophytorum TaxID=2067568 RepID=UPI000CFA9591|nr:TadA family conjugal transfer-associated ATPase [Microbacterium halophytorum]